jgi:hypothetical protein
MKKQRKTESIRPKLTLSIDSVLIEKAKEYASFKGKSLSYLVEEFFQELVNERESGYVHPISELDEIRSLVKGQIPRGVDYKEEIKKIKMQKLEQSK